MNASKLFFSLLLFLFTTCILSQPIQYTYDHSGNRVKKEIDINPGQLRKKVIYEDQVGLAELKIYPNPTTKLLFVELQEVSEQQTGLSVIDMNGRVIWESSQIKLLNQIDFSSYAKGKYVLRITNGEKISTWIIIKN